MANGAYPKDVALMRSLGLRTTGFDYDWTDLGTVVVEETRGERPAATVKVEVAALPAQFWRFTVIRPRDAADGIYEPLEVRVATTGSGAFSDYWAVAEMIARHLLDVTVPA